MARKKKSEQNEENRKPAPRGAEDGPAASQTGKGPRGRGRTGRKTALTPLQQAEALVEESLECDDPEEELKLAEMALQLSPDCADAYTVVANHQDTPDAALPFYERAVSTSRKVLGDQIFSDEAGTFWLNPATRPYMRAGLGRAQCLWALGSADIAISQAQDLLRLNPSDNQGVRYLLASWLLESGRDQDLESLLHQFEDENSTFWAYSRALLAFRREGDTEASRKLLSAARRANKHVVGYLLEHDVPDVGLPGFYSPGDQDEAAIYYADFRAGWHETSGAISWLRRSARRKKKKAASQADAPKVLEELRRLPQTFGTMWQAYVRRMPMWVYEGFEHIRPWAVLVMNGEDQMIVGQDLLMDEPTPEALWGVLVQAMRRPLIGNAARPAEIHLRDEPVWEALCTRLEEVGVDCIFKKELGDVEVAMNDLQASLEKEDEHIPALLDSPGVGLPQLEVFFRTAHDFYRRSPWKRRLDELLFKVTCDQIPGGPWWLALMGPALAKAGMALFAEDDVANQMSGDDCGHDHDHDGEHACSGSPDFGLLMLFGEPFDLALADLTAAEEHGWPVAGPEAYPFAYFRQRGAEPRQPGAGELELIVACLKTVPEFLSRATLEQQVTEEFTVSSGTRELRLKISWTPLPENEDDDEI